MGDPVLRSVRERSRPALSLRRQPGRLVLLVFRMPLRAYHHGMGWLLGRTFLLLTHVGRKTGQRHETVAMVLRYQPATGEAVVCSAWGPDTDWVQNIRAHPASQVQIGREVFTPQQRFLSEAESREVLVECVDKHPWRFRLVALVLGWGDLRVESVARDVAHTRPFVAFRPNASTEGGIGAGHVYQ